MYIQHLHIKNFRCFQNFSLDFNNKLTLITGSNGSGKSSLLEALHYGCYLRSFRTNTARDLMNFNDENFFIKIAIQETFNQFELARELHIGVSKKKRVIKIDQKAIDSYKELSSLYKVITITEDDLALIKGAPEIRRLFLDQVLMIEHQEFLSCAKKHKQILENRNALLHQEIHSQESYKLWTRQLWHEAQKIQEYRRSLLDKIQERTNLLLQKWFDATLTLSFVYQAKRLDISQDFDDFWQKIDAIKPAEYFLKRSLFGAHLDDFSIEFCQRTSRAFASRGQQKLIIILIKIALMQEVAEKKGRAIFLLDDFMTDFDQQKGTILLDLMLQLESQLIFTCPTNLGYCESLLMGYGAQRIFLTP